MAAGTDKPVQLEPIEMARTAEQRFEDYLQSRGMRNTEQRKNLIKLVFSSHEHFDADQLMEKLPAKGDAGYVSRPTVYRALSEFVDAGLLRKFELDGRSVYEHDYGYPQHDHLYCSKCHSLIEFQDDRLKEIRKKVAEDHHFQDRSHRLIITGICQPCRQSRRRKRRPVDLI
ncbi:MAG: transcriptional repressor [Mariniblastus sp.]|nr:transcriptional repressor [Mariniblastus sp.]